jgi:hypothetical protein
VPPKHKCSNQCSFGRLHKAWRWLQCKPKHVTDVVFHNNIWRVVFDVIHLLIHGVTSHTKIILALNIKTPPISSKETFFKIKRDINLLGLCSCQLWFVRARVLFGLIIVPATANLIVNCASHHCEDVFICDHMLAKQTGHLTSQHGNYWNTVSLFIYLFIFYFF